MTDRADLLRRHGPLALLLVLAVVLRARGLGEWWLNPDEGIYYSILTRETWAGFWSEVMGNAHPPLYYLILRALGVLSWDFVWFRVFSLVCGVAAVAGAWAVGRELGGPGRGGAIAGALAGLAMATSPAAIGMSQVMRPYTLQLALVLGALFFLLRHQRLGATRDLAAYATFLVLALLTHYSSGLVLAVFALLVVHDGVTKSWSRREWARMGAWHAPGAIVVLALAALHLRPLAASPIVDDALNGWLRAYMFDSLSSAWHGYVDYHGLVVGGGLHASVALLFLAALGLAVGVRAPKPAILGVGALVVGAAAAALGVYPFGATRHAMWLLAFTVPVLGWAVARTAALPPRRAALGLAIVVAMLAGGRPVGDLLGAERTMGSAAEQVLRREDLTRLVDLLDPEGEPRLVVMGAETFYLLLPFYAVEREDAVFASDSTLLHFPYGSRRVLVAWTWTVGAGADLSAPGHLATTLQRAASEFPDLRLDEAEDGVLLVGAGRGSLLLREIAAHTGPEPIVVGERSVPGLSAYLFVPNALRRAFTP